jgi:capsular polysaccharide export protein
MSISKQVLLLQGPVGPFFDRLHTQLLEDQSKCTRVLFNAGDKLFCRNKKSALFFEGNLDEWNIWLNEYLKNNKPSVVILFGSDRPIHSIARQVCKENEIFTLCLEEGYIRPGYVTLEAGGNNANSPLAGLLPDKNQEINEVDLLSSSSKDHLKNSFRNRCWYGFLYYTCSELFSSDKQRKLFHKNLNLFNQAFNWLNNFILWNFKRKYDQRFFQKLINSNYHLVVLQLDSDMQSRFQSNGWKKIDLINETIKSFANIGLPESHLIFKVHPLERGHYNHNKIIKRIAENFGIEDRVWIVQTGSVGQWIRHSKGIITINSTSGLSAIYHGVPILLLGNAIYDNKQLVYKLGNKKDLDKFWSVKEKADQEERMRYLSWVREGACSVGDFYTQLGNRDISQNIIEIIK